MGARPASRTSTVDFIVKTTASSLESFQEVTARGPDGPMLVSTVDAWCAAEDFAQFAARAAARPDEATVLGGDPARRRREAALGDPRRGRAGGRDRRAGRWPGHRRGVPRLRAGAAGRGARRRSGGCGSTSSGCTGAASRSTARSSRRWWTWTAAWTWRRRRRSREDDGAHEPERRSGVSERTYWGLFREREHSPGREGDDAEILRLTGKHLEGLGVQVELRAPEELSAAETPPDGIFLMCERMEALRVLLAWQERGVRQVNAPGAVLNTYRERMIAQLREANVPFIQSQVVATQGAEAGLRAPIWVKRADVHNTQEGDVVFARTRDEAAAALAGLAARGFERAVLQPPVEGDLIKFYGVGSRRRRRRRAGLVPLVLPQGPAGGRASVRAGPAGPPGARGRDRARARGLRRRRDRHRGRRARAARPQRVAELRPLPRRGRAGDRRVPGPALRAAARREPDDDRCAREVGPRSREIVAREGATSRPATSPSRSTRGWRWRAARAAR